MMSMMPWCCSRFSADEVTEAIAAAAGETARAEMQGAVSVGDATPLLKGVVALATSGCSQPLGPAVRFRCSQSLYCTLCGMLDRSVDRVLKVRCVCRL